MPYQGIGLRNPEVSVMETRISIPLKFYDLWLGRCPSESREYAWLRNGVIDDGEDGAGKQVQILCDTDTAKALMDCAAHLCPEIIPYLKQISEPTV